MCKIRRLIDLRSPNLTIQYLVENNAIIMALGKSLNNILGDYFGEETQEASISNNPKKKISGQTMKVANVPLSKIKITKYQMRTHFDTESIDSLALSIKNDGMIHPIMLVHNENEDVYGLISGERRFRAVKQLDWETIPAIIREKSSLTPEQKTMLSAVENLQRENLSPIEQAKTYQTIMKIKSCDADTVASFFNVSGQYIRNYVRLLGTSPKVQRSLAKKEISEGQARMLTQISHADQDYALEQILTKNLGIKEIERLVRLIQNPDKKTIQMKEYHKLPDKIVSQVETIRNFFPNVRIKMYGDETAGKINIFW